MRPEHKMNRCHYLTVLDDGHGKWWKMVRNLKDGETAEVPFENDIVSRGNKYDDTHATGRRFDRIREHMRYGFRKVYVRFCAEVRLPATVVRIWKDKTGLCWAEIRLDGTRDAKVAA